MSFFQQTGNRLTYHYDAEELWLEPWGENSLRVRATKQAEMPKENWALLETPECEAKIEITENGARISLQILALSVFPISALPSTALPPATDPLAACTHPALWVLALSVYTPAFAAILRTSLLSADLCGISFPALCSSFL